MDKDLTKWFTPKGRGKEDRIEKDDRRKRKEMTPEEDNEERRRRRKSEGEAGSREGAFAKSNLTKRSPAEKKEEGGGKLDMEIMVKMIAEKQKEAMEELTERIMEKQEEELRKLKEELKERDERKEKKWEEKWNKWEREAREKEEVRERKDRERQEKRMREEEEKKEEIERRLRSVERGWKEIKEREAKEEERGKEWEEMKRDFEEWRKCREERNENNKKGEEDEKAKEEEIKVRRIQRIAEEMEREKKRKNLVITGLQGEWSREALSNWIRKKLDVEIEIAEMWRVGEGKGKIVIKCKDEEGKEKVLRNKSKLGRERTYIENDLTFKERRMRERTINKARELRNQGLRVRIGMNKVFGEKHDWIWSTTEEKWFQKGKKGGSGEEDVRMERGGEQEDRQRRMESN